MKNQDIAIVGMSVFCPIGDSVDEVWQGLARGGDFITRVPGDVIESYHFEGVPNSVDRFYCDRGGFCREFKVDPIRYGVMPITAASTDPDQLVSMAMAEQALDDAGVFAKEIPLQKCSVIIGKGGFSGVVSLRALDVTRSANQLSALLKSVLPQLTEADLTLVREAYQSKQGRYHPDMATGTMPNLVASLVANRFDMHGPAYTVDAACASGIVAINHSMELLRSGRCDIALAGGMHTLHSAMFWSAFDMLGAMSRKKVISPFSEDADGLLIGQGGGYVVLKTLDKALEDEDRIYAVIKETAVCSDGTSSHVMVTSVAGQVRVLEQAWQKSGLDEKRIGYIEAHGTGTIVGDRTEITTLKTFFGDNTFPRAYVGSVKSNMGHAMPAAGMIGVIKTALALYWRKIPATLHCERPLAAMFESRFLPPQELTDWDGEQFPLVAGVNAFGFGGINAHAILTAYEPETGGARKLPKPYFGEALMMSARSGKALIAKLEAGDYTDTGGDYRLVIFDPDEKRIGQAVAVIEKDKPWRGRADIWFSNRPLLIEGGRTVFLFPGFSLEWDRASLPLSSMLDLPDMESVVEQYAGAQGAEEMQDTPDTPEMGALRESGALYLRAQYTKFLCKMGLDKLDVTGDMYAGHSIGEWDAAEYAGMTDSDMELWKNNMSVLSGLDKFYPTIAVSGLDRRSAEALCESVPDIWLASDNCPSQVLIVGKESSMDMLRKRFDEERVFYTVMPFGVAWHTPLAEEETRLRGEILKDVRVQEGRVPVWSAHTLERVPSDKDRYVALQSEQLTKPVYFRELIEKLYDEEQARVFIQVGYGSLTGFVEDILKDKNIAAVSTCLSVRSSMDQLRRVLALLFIEGRKVDAGFLGVKPLYRAENPLLTLQKGAPPIVRELPELNEAIAQRYGAAGPFAEAEGAGPALPRHAVAAAVEENIRDAIAVQREMARLFEGVLPEGGSLPVVASRSKKDDAHLPVSDDSVRTSRVGESFEEALSLSFADHPYLVDHSIVRQPKGWAIPEDLNPVVPFTMTLELFAEAAKKRAPGEKLLKICNVAAYKWIGLERPVATVMKGKWIRQNTLELSLGEFARAECVFGEAWPESPAEFAGEADLGKEIMGIVPSSQLYDRFSFHGPQYHSVLAQKRISERGMQSAVEKQAGKGSLLDAMGQQLGLFLHLTQRSNTISFPVRLKELAFFADIFDQAGTFDHTLMIKQLTQNVVTGDMVLKREGLIWSVARDFVCQRFVNIIPVWNVILKPMQHKLADEIAPGVYFFESSSQDNILFLLAKRYLSGPDRDIYEGLASPQSKRENIISRIALKDGVRLFAAGRQREKGGGPREAESGLLYPVEFFCVHDEKGRPSVRGYGRAAAMVDSLQVSLAHKGTAAAAIVAEDPVGIDLEVVEEKQESFIRTICTDREMELLKEMDGPEAVIRFWVAKEACAKKAGTGLQGGAKTYEVRAVQGDTLVVGDERVRTAAVGTEHIVGWTL